MAHITLEDVRRIADEHADGNGFTIPRELLSRPESNFKIRKNMKEGYLTCGLALAPARLAGYEACAWRTPGCTAACLNISGNGLRFASIHHARIRKAQWFKRDRAAFMLKLEREIARLERRANSLGMIPCVRLNVVSDFPWESVRYTDADGVRWPNLMTRFPAVSFYDYTKAPHRFARDLPPNYDLTFSLAESNEEHALQAMANGARVAVVFRNALRPSAKKWTFPETWRGIPVVDGDVTDLRLLDPPAVWVGLRAKGLAKKDTSGFVHDIEPATVAA